VPNRFETAFSVTAWFETGDQPYTNPSGNFDGQGLSWGPRQNCIGQGSLQPLLRRMLVEQPVTMERVLGSLLPVLQDIAAPAPTKDQLAKTIKIMNDDRGHLLPAWRTAFATLGTYPEFQEIFMDDAKGSTPAVDQLAAWISVGNQPTLREWCLAYDFVTQNGGFSTAFKLAISTFLLALKPFQRDPVKDRMRAMCWLRAGWTYILGNRAFADDVLSRKLLIVEGSGRFRGSDVDLDSKFGVTDEVVS
jgi:hypothetical protein